MMRALPMVSFNESSQSANARDRSNSIMSGSYSLGYKLASSAFLRMNPGVLLSGYSVDLIDLEESEYRGEAIWSNSRLLPGFLPANSQFFADFRNGLTVTRLQVIARPNQTPAQPPATPAASTPTRAPRTPAPLPASVRWRCCRCFC